MNSLKSLKKFCSQPITQEQYPMAMRLFHWGMGLGIAGCVAFVKLAQWTPKEDEKTMIYYMKLHKSFGLLMALSIIPRLLVRKAAVIPAPLEGPAFFQKSGLLAHKALYGLMIFLPLSGITMGYFSGKGLPFFGYLIPGKKQPVGEIAGLAYKTHKWAGQILQYLVPLHIAGAGVHVVKGQKVFHRMNPFA